MVVVYLRGLLNPKPKYGHRSFASEDVVIESLAALNLAEGMESSLEKDYALLPLMTQQGVQETLSSIGTRQQRARELKLLDIFKVAEQIGNKLKSANPTGEISLFQAYQIAEKNGIFEAFDDHYREENSKPLL